MNDHDDVMFKLKRAKSSSGLGRTMSTENSKINQICIRHSHDQTRGHIDNTRRVPVQRAVERDEIPYP